MSRHCEYYGIDRERVFLLRSAVNYMATYERIHLSRTLLIETLIYILVWMNSELAKNSFRELYKQQFTLLDPRYMKLNFSLRGTDHCFGKEHTHRSSGMHFS